MAKVTIMSWNIQDIGDAKLGPSSSSSARLDAFCNLIAYFIQNNKVDILGIMEIRSEWGDELGQNICNKLLVNHGLVFHKSESAYKYNIKKLDDKIYRKEQYLYLWNTAVVDSIPLPSGNLFESDFYQWFQDPTTGVWKQVGLDFRLKRDRHPFCGLFKEKVSSKGCEFPVIMYHALGPGSLPQDGNERLAYISYIQPKTPGTVAPGVVMGDFNITPSVAGESYSKANANKSFLKLKSLTFDWQLYFTDPSIKQKSGSFTTLKPRREKANNVHDIYQSDYDNFYTNIPMTNEGVLNFIEDVMPTEASYDATLNTLLRTYIYEREIADKKASTAKLVNFTTADEAFKAFSRHISDHLPIIAELNF